VKDERLYVIHMVECAERIAKYTREGRGAFLKDERTQDAVVRNFEIIGEAAKRVSEVTRALAPDIPWKKIAGFRDVLIHQYEGVDLEETWKRVEQDLPQLLNNLKALLTKMERQR